MQVQVILNCTDNNPYLRMGLTANPFPVIADASPKYQAANRILSDLKANPIKDENDLRARLKGCKEGFISLCVSKYEKGKMVKFWISWPE